MPGYSLKLVPSVVSTLQRMKRRDSVMYGRISSALDDIEKEPWQGKPLSGELKGRYSWRVGSYRIIYAVMDNVLTVLVVDIGHRKGIYRR